ncbi:MAG: cysteine methyltransferase [Zetaproteobacteria bacterium]|nr:MAG: cysteine methyltransferase [Zetaproteobacteria bacterium]
MEKITYGFYQSPIGEMVLAQSEKGLCWLGFMVGGYKGNGYDRLVEHLRNVELVQDDGVLEGLGDRLVESWKQGNVSDILLDLRGTEFQKSVWMALLNIPRGRVKSYADVANDIGKPLASRAVGSAVGSNPVSLIVPCHRVVKKSGSIGNFGWGVDLKRRILSEEGVEI